MNVTGVEPDPNDEPEYEERGDFDAFSRWHRPRLVQWYTRRGLSPEDAADLAQEALHGLSRRWPRLETAEHRRRSYYTITKNKLADFFRKQGRRIQPEVSLDDDTGPELVADEQATNPDVMVAGNDAHPVWNHVDRLPDARRDALLGRVVYRMSYDELADATGRSEPALRQDVARALASLRRGLKAGFCLLGAWAMKVRRANARSAKTALASATSTAMAVIPQGALLSLLLTSPLYVLPAKSAIAGAATELPRIVIATLTGPAPGIVIDHFVPTTPTRSHRPGRPRPGLLHRPAPVTVAVPDPPVSPPDVCLQKRCGTGSRITVSVLGHEQALPSQSYVDDVCWAVPGQAEPYATCSEGTDPP